HGIQHAATIAYFALLSMLPFTLLTALILARLTTTLAVELGEGPVIDRLLDPLGDVPPLMGRHLRHPVQSLAATQTSEPRATGVVLLFGAMSVFDAITAGVNRMLATRARRRYLLTKVILAGFVVTI